MSDKLLVSTRKGLFTVVAPGRAVGDRGRRFPGRQRHPHADRPRDGRSYAALDHGHFGVKLHRSTATRLGGDRRPGLSRPSRKATRRTTCGAGRSTGARRASGRSRPGGADEPGVLWCGTLPGGLFRSSDHGQSWEMCAPLWDHPKRKQWMGGGADLPGIHSICVDPRDAKRVWVAVSTGGIWRPRTPARAGR